MPHYHVTVAGGSGDALSGRQMFAYDRLNRLITSTGLVSGARSYTYDLDSNRLTKTEGGTTSNATYDATGALKQVWQTGQGLPQFATHDAFGNLLANPETGLAAPTFSYDAANRLTAIDAAGSTNDTSFGFDALGRHLSRTINGTTETYEFLGSTETVTRIDAATDIAGLVDDTGARQATLSGSSVAWLMPDPHGNVASGAQASALTTALRYDGYGQTIATAPTSLPAEAKRWKYQGRLDIAPEGLTTPLYEFSARFYAPGLGTFTQLDPLQGSALDPLTLNRYLYAAANPATLIDPTGHFTMEKDDPSDPCRNRGDAGCGETAVANPGPAGGWKSSTGAVYSSYTGNTNSNNSPSTSVVNQTAGGSDPPPQFPGPASEYPGYDVAHNTAIDCQISNGGNFVSTLQCAQNLLGESWGRWAFKEFIGKGDRQFMESDLDEAERKCLSGITGFCATYQALLPFYQDDTQNPLGAAIGAAFVYRYLLRASVRSDPSRVRAAVGETPG
ncbi:MAG TPA: RHS repeat-associated core domain-containing protein, partial [Propionibacteriaceae bacterium]